MHTVVCASPNPLKIRIDKCNYKTIKLIVAVDAINYKLAQLFPGSRDSSVGIATRYGLEGPGIECR
jgi:hypothetical protein